MLYSHIIYLPLLNNYIISLHAYVSSCQTNVSSSAASFNWTLSQPRMTKLGVLNSVAWSLELISKLYSPRRKYELTNNDLLPVNAWLKPFIWHFPSWVECSPVLLFHPERSDHSSGVSPGSFQCARRARPALRSLAPLSVNRRETCCRHSNRVKAGVRDKTSSLLDVFQRQRPQDTMVQNVSKCIVFWENIKYS